MLGSHVLEIDATRIGVGVDLLCGLDECLEVLGEIALCDLEHSTERHGDELTRLEQPFHPGGADRM